MPYIREHWNYLTEPGVFPGVDLLRAIAVSLVLLYHFQLLPVGWVGVDLFFVISGFLIGGIIIDKMAVGKFKMGEFYWRRALRILPVYYFIILLCALFKAPGPFDWVALKSVLSGMLFLQTTGPYFFPEFFQINQAYTAAGSWSLVIEEMFYLVAPVTLLVFMRLSKNNLKIVASLVGLVVLSGIFTRIVMTADFAPNDGDWHFASFIQFHSRYDELAAGVLAACVVRLVSGLRSQWVFWLAAGLLLFAGFLMYMIQHPEYLAKPWTFARETIWLPTLLAAFSTALLLGIYWWPVRSLPIIFLARISYPLYLVHLLLLELTNPYGNVGILLWLTETITFYGRLFVLILLTIFISYLVSLIVEYPFVRMYKVRKESTTELDASFSPAR